MNEDETGTAAVFTKKVYLRMKKAPLLTFVICFFACSYAASANGLIPAVNAYRSTRVFYFIFIAVVLIESICIRVWLRPIHLVSILWRIVVVNAISSIAGYWLMRSPLRPDSYYVWKQAIPFFFLTLTVELPLIFLFFCKKGVSWLKKILMGTVINVLSYIFLILAEGPIEYIWMDGLWMDDHRIFLQWDDADMLHNAGGVIYGTEYSPKGLPHRFRYFDLQDQRWHSMANCSGIDPGCWDAEGDVIAFKWYQQGGYSNQDIAVCRLPDFDVICRIAITNTPKIRRLWELQISPDRSKLAVLIPQHEITAPLEANRYSYFGVTHNLNIYDIQSGRLLSVCPRKVSRHICWLPDSQNILFDSLRDPTLHSITSLDIGWKKKVKMIEQRFTDTPAYKYNLSTGEVEYFGEEFPDQLATQAGQLVYTLDRNSVRLVDIATGNTNQFYIGRFGHAGVVVSPDCRFAIIHFTLSHPLGYLGNPVITELNDPERRYFLDTYDYRLDWTTKWQDLR